MTFSLGAIAGMARPSDVPHYVPQVDGKTGFRSAMMSHGLDPDDIEADGEFHRFQVGNGKKNLDGWYVFNELDYGYAGSFGDWSSGNEWVNWTSFEESALDAKQQAELRRQKAETKRKLEEKKTKRLEDGKAKAARILGKMVAADENFPYFANKNVKPANGVMMNQGADLVYIPVYDIRGDVQSYQTITPDGTKKFMSDGVTRGGFFALEGDNSTICLCEGYSTAYTIWEATGYTTVCAFNAGNLVPVADTMQRTISSASFIVCADNDHTKQTNAGVNYGRKAVKVCGGTIVFPEVEQGITDFNDLAVKHGLEAVRNTILNRFKPIAVKSTLDYIPGYELTQNIRKPQWAIAGVLEEKPMAMLYGPSGTYKTFMALSWALCMATATPWYGHAVSEEPYPVLYVIGEGMGGFGARMKAWELEHSKSTKGFPFYVTTGPAQFLDEDGAQQIFSIIQDIRAIHGKAPAIFIDTVARNYGPGDENSTQDMTRFIATLDAVVGNDCMRLLVHHTGHEATGRARGSSALKAALDVEYSIAREYDSTGTRLNIVLSNTKMKEAEEWHHEMVFAKKRIVIGEEDGDEILGMVLSLEDAKRKKGKKLSAKQEDTLDLIARIKAGDYEGRTFKILGGPLQKQNFSSLLVEEEIYQGKNVARDVKNMVKRGVIQIIDGKVQ